MTSLQRVDLVASNEKAGLPKESPPDRDLPVRRYDECVRACPRAASMCEDKDPMIESHAA